MAAKVSSLVPILSKVEGEGKSRDLVTRDLLGGCGTSDLGPQIPSALDLLSRKEYLERCRPNPELGHLHDLNLPPPSTDYIWVTAHRPVSSYQSVCTLDKVRAALERAERESYSSKKQRHRPQGSECSAASPALSSTTTTTTTTSSMKKRRICDEGEEEGSDSSSVSVSPTAMMTAAGCPRCLLYVLISNENPRCPRCNSHVPIPLLKSNKPWIDLNSSTQLQTLI